MSASTSLIVKYIACLWLTAVASAATQSYPPTNESVPVKFLGTLGLSNPSFAAVAFQDDPSLLITSLSTSGQGTVYTIDNITDLSSSFSSKKARPVPGKINWANDATEAPKELFGSDGMVVGGGALLASSSPAGGIYYSAIVNGVAQRWIRLVAKSDWFYHHIIFADLDGSGIPQMVCCRTAKHAGGQSMLVTLKVQDNKNPAGPWVEAEIHAGCNAVAVSDLNGDSSPEIVAVSAHAVAIFYSPSKWQDPSDVKNVIIDKTLNGASDIQIVDMDGDGKPDLLVSDQGGGGSVLAYQNTGVISSSAFNTYTLAFGFSTVQQPPSSPRVGSLVPFFSTGGSSGFPYVALAGGAAEAAYVLVPTGVWRYDITVLHRCHCTVGKLAVADLNGRGKQEIFVPCTGRNNVAAYSIGS